MLIAVLNAHRNLTFFSSILCSNKVIDKVNETLGSFRQHPEKILNGRTFTGWNRDIELRHMSLYSLTVNIPYAECCSVDWKWSMCENITGMLPGKGCWLAPGISHTPQSQQTLWSWWEAEREKGWSAQKKNSKSSIKRRSLGARSLEDFLLTGRVWRACR